MTPENTLHPENAVREEAMRWYVLAKDGDLSAQSQTALKRWLAQDESHLAAYEQVGILWSQLQSLPSQSAATHPPRSAPARRWRRAVKAVAGAAIAASIAAAVIVFLPSTAVEMEVAETALGEIKTVKLPDNSAVTLGAKSRLMFDFSGQTRRVTLASGEAYFDVTSDAARPFVVAAGPAQVRVVGTEFAVKKAGANAEIAVAEGSVDVSLVTTPMRISNLQPGEWITASKTAGLSAVTSMQAGDIAAWRSGQLVYVDARLEDVIADANRYYSGGLYILDDEARALAINAIFNTSDIAAMLADLEAALPITVSGSAPGAITITAQTKQAQIQ
ncbi:MAG: FecR domain-containing protein [Sphingomonadales bacterium]